MQNKSVLILLTVAIIEGVFISYILSKPSPFRTIKVVTTYIAVINPSPLYWALQYDVPDKKFEELVKQNPKYVRYCESETGWTALSDCVASKRTNCVRVLLANGANFEESLEAERKVNDAGAIILLQQAEAEFKK